MTTTPTVWIDEFTTNFNSDDFRYGPVVTGLSNGNFLVTWVDNNDTVAGGFGFDIVGVIFDALGNPITGTLYLNDGFANSRDESSPVVAATSDGGFVVIWEFLGDTQNNTGFEHDIIFGRFDETGTRTIGGFVENDVSGAPSYRFPSVAVASDDSFFVTYERHDGTDDNIVGRKISSTGSVGSLQVLRQDFTLNGTNQAEDPQSPDTAVLTDGTFVTAYLQKDNNGGTNEYTVALRASTAAGANSYNLAVSSVDGALDSDPRTAGLASDKFAVVWSSGGTIQGRLYNNNGTLAGFQFTVHAFAGKSFLKPDVVGLEDGGFYAVWYNVSDNRLEGARFDSTGTQVGSTFIISFSIDASITGPQLGLTSDGRILVTWTDGTDIRTEILDPRDNPIAVEAGDGQTTARPEGSTMTGTSDNEILYGSDLIDTIDGRNGDDTIDGRGGDDNLSGGSGVDTIRGGGGADQIDGGAETDTLSGDDGDDTFVVADGHFFDNVDGGFGTDTLDHSAVTRSGDVFDFAAGQITTTFATGTPTIVSIERYLDGTGGNEIILPSTGLYVEAGIGNDIVRESSAAAADVIDLGPDSDALYINNKVISDDSFDGGAGIDWVYFSDLTFAPIAVIDIVIDLNAETLSSLGGNFVETLANFENVAGSQGEETIIGSSGQNVLRGEGGNDIISGGGGNDTIIGGPGADAIDGGTGADTANYSDSSAGINIQLQYGVIEGGDADGDTLTGIENITGTNKNDIIYGDPNNNFLHGLGGSDKLKGLNGADALFGDDGDDWLYVDNLDIGAFGGTGTDRLVVVSAAGVTNTVGTTGIEIATGNIGDDTFDGTGATADLTLKGLSGNDVLTGGDGDDYLYGGGGADQLVGGLGLDRLFIDENDTVIDGGAGDEDRVLVQQLASAATGVTVDMAASNIEIAFGNLKNDTFDGSGATIALSLYGRQGQDILIGGSGNDRLFGDNNDTAAGDILNGGAGNDFLRGGSNGAGGFAERDQFRFDADWGADRIFDFANNSFEKIDFSSVAGITQRSDLSFSAGTDATGAYTLISYTDGGGWTGTIRVYGVTEAQLQDNDFIYV